MKYLIMIRHNPQSRELFMRLSADQRTEGLAAYARLNEELAASGELVVSEALADPALAKQVLVRDGQTVTSDGPFAEAKEHLAGIYLVDCDSIDRAVEYAARIPEAQHLPVEVRPVMDLGAFEM